MMSYPSTISRLIVYFIINLLLVNLAFGEKPVKVLDSYNQNNYTEVVLTRSDEKYYVLNAYDREDTLAVSSAIFADEIISTAFSLLPDGGNIRIETGEYPIEKTIYLKSNYLIAGVDTTAVIKKISEGSIFEGTNIHDLTIRNLKIESDFTYNIIAALYFIGYCTDNTIDGLVIDKIGGHGIYFQNLQCQHNVIQNNIIRDCLGAGIALYNGAGNAIILNNRIYRTQIHGIIVSAGGSNCVIQNNYVQESGFYRPDADGYFCHGIAIDGSGIRNGKNHLVKGNHIINAGSAGIEIADWQDSVVIRDNIIEGTGMYAPFDQYGIYFGGGIKPGVYAEVVNNTVKNTKWCGIRIDSGTAEYTKSVRVDSNYVSNTARFGILIGTVDKVSVSNNEVERTNMSGIAIKGSSNQLFIAKNVNITKNIVSSSSEYGVFLSNADMIEVSYNGLCNNSLGGLQKGTGLGRNISIFSNECVTDDIPSGIPQYENTSIELRRNDNESYTIIGLTPGVSSNLVISDITGRIIIQTKCTDSEEVTVKLPNASNLYLLIIYNQSNEIIFRKAFVSIKKS